MEAAEQESLSSSATAPPPPRKQKQDFENLTREEVLSALVGDPSSIHRTQKFGEWLEKQCKRKKRERDKVASTLKPGQRLDDLFSANGFSMDEHADMPQDPRNPLPPPPEALEPLPKTELHVLVERLLIKVFGKSRLAPYRRADAAGQDTRRRLQNQENAQKTDISVNDFHQLCEQLPFIKAYLFPLWSEKGPLGLSKKLRGAAKRAKQGRAVVVEALVSEKARSDCYIM